MSSNMKDARWHLAQGLVVGVAEMDWDDLSYEEHIVVLDAAQMLLNKMTEADVAFFARRWRSDSDDETIPPWA